MVWLPRGACLPGLAGVFLPSHSSNLLRDELVTQINPDSALELLLDLFLLHCRNGRNGNPGLSWGASLPGRDARREEPWAKDTHSSSWWHYRDPKSSCSFREVHPWTLCHISQSPSHRPLFIFSLSQFVLALLAPRGVLANISCFLISSYLHKNEKHQGT